VTLEGLPDPAPGSRHRVGGFRAKPSGENPHDFFPTPPAVTRAFIEEVPLPDGLWCEPCVGDGHIIKAVGPREGWATYDIRDVERPELSDHHESAYDFLEHDESLRFDVIITNPPFYLAEEIVRKALSCATHVAMLLRLAFLETRKREAFHAEHPSDVHVLSRRPSFMANGATDSSAYAWFHWGPGCGNRWSILKTEQTRKK
jgi:hypothetical protein